MNYCDEINLEMYNLFNKYDDITMRSFMNECVLIMENNNTIDNMKAILEAEGEEKQGVIAQIISFFAKLWDTFLGKVIGFTKRDKNFLEDANNKNIILNKPFKEDFNFTMYNFPQGESLIANTSLPDMNYTAMKDKLVDEVTFGKTYFANIMKAGGGINDNNKVKIQDLARAYFRGSNEPIKIKASSLDKKAMYNFCVNYEAFANKIKEDTKKLKDAANEAIKQEKKSAREKISEATDIFESSSYLSYVYEAFILEADETDNKTNSTIPQRDDGNNTNNNQQSASSPNNNTNDKKELKNELNEITKRIKLYIKVCGAIFGAKLQVGEEIYKAYIDILKAHVNDYKGEQQNNDNNNNSNTNNNSDEATINNAFK